GVLHFGQVLKKSCNAVRRHWAGDRGLRKPTTGTPLCCARGKPRGIPHVDDRHVLNGIFWVLRSGAPGVTCPRLVVTAPRATTASFVGDGLAYGTGSRMRWPPIITLERCDRGNAPSARKERFLENNP